MVLTHSLPACVSCGVFGRHSCLQTDMRSVAASRTSQAVYVSSDCALRDPDGRMPCRIRAALEPHAPRCDLECHISHVALVTGACWYHATPFRQVFLRAGLQLLKLDSVGANELADVKKPGSSEHPCGQCNISRAELGDPHFDIHGNARTTRGIVDGLRRVRETVGKSAKEAVSRELGVVVRGDCSNPFREHALVDTVNQICVDRFHQDATVSLVPDILSESG